MEKIFISSYSSVIDKQDKDIELHDFLRGIKNGQWQDQVLYIRTIKDKKARSAEKQKCPLVTVSGSFSERKDAAIRKHSGFIAIDIDNIENAETVKDLIKSDPYVYAAFVSISGNGLCLLIRIDGTRHADAFEGLASYLYESYQLIVDQSGKNISRARFISYDPDLYLNEKAQMFKKYLKKDKPKKINRVVFVRSDFDNMIKQMYDRGVNICEDYGEWISTAYALISEFSESGRDYFHTLSSLSSKYNPADTDRQFDACLKNTGGERAKKATIASIYFHAKQAGIEIYSDRTKEVVRSAASQKRAGVKADDVERSLHEFAGISPEQSREIINQVFGNDIKHKSDNLVDDVVAFLRPYKLRKNLITRAVELRGKPIDDSDINSIYLDCKVAFDAVTKDLICSILFSNRIEAYNPIHSFFANRQIVQDDCPNLALLLSSIITDTPNADKWIMKWLVSAVASAYGKHSPLVLVLSGEIQGTGKTHWFRYLLPQQLQPLFAESKMDAGKDDEILMTKKWIILDDEYGGKSKREEKRLKEITSKQWINVREPYGRVSVDLKRLAVFCGTSNETQILNDPTGNRRIIPIHTIGIDHTHYNNCDKEQLWVEIYSMYKAGFDYSVLAEEINQLNANTEDFKQSTPEEELIAVKLSPNGVMPEWMNITQIIQFLIADTKYTNLSNTRIGIILNNLGFEKKRMRIGGSVVTAFKVNKLTNGSPNPFA
jgi:predicted P-loop ATPase